MKNSDDKGMVVNSLIRDFKPGNPWERISEIAARLGVKPTDGGRASIIATGADGLNYDVWEVVAAFLDKMDSVERAHQHEDD